MARRIRVSYTIRDAARVLRALRSEAKAHEDQGILVPVYRALADDLERRITALLPMTAVETGELKAESAFTDYVLHGPKSRRDEDGTND